MTNPQWQRTLQASTAFLLGAIVFWTPTTLAASEARMLTPTELASRIDEQIAAKWQTLKVTSAPPADDAEWGRRAHLDLEGRIPDVLTVRDFLDDPAADKRSRLIDTLLNSDRYAIHWATVWRASWLPPQSGGDMEAWLRLVLKENRPFDQIARAVLTGAAETAAFDAAYENKPQNLAGAGARLFLGVKIECAECHDHPFAKWTRQQFWETAAFFGPAGEVRFLDTGAVVKARFLDGTAPEGAVPPRIALAEWVTSKTNPSFARAAVNRVWEYLLGTGLVEPVGEEGENADNRTSHPDLLDLLATQFAAHDFDLKYLIKAVMLSKPYQLSSRETHASQADPRAFGRTCVRGLSPEQLFDSLMVAGGIGQAPETDSRSLRADFLQRFATQGKRSEQPTSILQALHMMNGKLVSDASSLEHNTNLIVIARGKTIRTSRKVEQLFLIALARKPTSAESTRLTEYVDRGGPTHDPVRALCDVFWALLNSGEFALNH